MLVNHLLLPLNIKENGKIIKTVDGAFNLEAINKKYSCSNVLLTKLIQKSILQGDSILGHLTSPLSLFLIEFGECYQYPAN